MSQVFSSKFKWETHPNPLSRLLEQKRHAGASILDLTESNPTRAALDYPSGEILSALSDARALRYDPNPRGLDAAREAVSSYYAARGFNVDPARILLTASTSEAYAYVFKLLCDPGDEVLVPRPSYPLFEFLAAMESVHVRQYPLRYDGAWHIDLNALDAAIGSRTKAIVVVNPNNPTGSFLKRDEWERIQQFGLPVLSDEVFSDFSFAPDPGRVPSLVASESVLTFSMSGLSKIAGLPQMKLGWIVVSGPQHPSALDRLEWISDTFLSVGTPVQIALPKLLQAGDLIRRKIQERCLDNLEFLRHQHGTASFRQGTISTPLRSVPRLSSNVLNTEGGWYAILQVPRTRSEEEWTLHLLTHDDVLVQPGFFYDFESEAFLILSLLTPKKTFQEGVRRILARMG
jgi:alanine-synthesizing transaminase